MPCGHPGRRLRRALSLVFFVIDRRWPAVAGQPRRPHRPRVLVLRRLDRPVGDARRRDRRGHRHRDQRGAQPERTDGARVPRSREPVRGQPAWLQALVIVLLVDFTGYWSHRVFHAWGPAWRLHAIHHSSTQVGWLSAARLHPRRRRAEQHRRRRRLRAHRGARATLAD
ncbi:MAG: sterol desaturase family protein [Chloroflexi bacterium]|nr:sterol desaturase family protein [Chloroflexota bacterium]